MENYSADPKRYDSGMLYERCGRSGVLLPKVSLGFWHNFGGVDTYERSREITPSTALSAATCSLARAAWHSGQLHSLW